MFDYRSAIEEARAFFAVTALPSLEIHDERAAFLAGSQGGVTSQNGEDGVLAALFDRIGRRNRWCFEVGAHDGRTMSNTWALREDGWDAVLIEADPERETELRRSALGKPNVRAVHARVGGFGSLDRILGDACAPEDLDLGVIDVDGPDVAVWWGMKFFRPRVMLVEFNPTGDGVQGGQTQWQAGLARTADVGRQKGYVLAGTVVHNALFVLESVMKEIG